MRVHLIDIWQKNLGPVVQSVVNLTSSLKVISLAVLADSIYNILIFFFCWKNVSSFALQKLLTFFSKKIQHICVSLDVNFNESIANDVDSFEQLGRGHFLFENKFRHFNLVARYLENCLSHCLEIWRGDREC